MIDREREIERDRERGGVAKEIELKKERKKSTDCSDPCFLFSGIVRVKQWQE